MLGFVKREFFEAEAEAQAVPTVDLGFGGAAAPAAPAAPPAAPAPPADPGTAGGPSAGPPAG
jgi:hypothetical protein